MDLFPANAQYNAYFYANLIATLLGFLILVLFYSYRRYLFVKPSVMILACYHILAQWPLVLLSPFMEGFLPAPWVFAGFVHGFVLIGLFTSFISFNRSARSIWDGLSVASASSASPPRLELLALLCIVAILAAMYLAFVPFEHTGLYALFTDPERAAEARESSLKLLDNWIPKYALTLLGNVIAPLITVAAIHFILLNRKCTMWEKALCIAVLAICWALAALSGAKGIWSYLIVATLAVIAWRLRLRIPTILVVAGLAAVLAPAFIVFMLFSLTTDGANCPVPSPASSTQASVIDQVGTKQSSMQIQPKEPAEKIQPKAPTEQVRESEKPIEQSKKRTAEPTERPQVSRGQNSDINGKPSQENPEVASIHPENFCSIRIDITKTHAAIKRNQNPSISIMAALGLPQPDPALGPKVASQAARDTSLIGTPNAASQERPNKASQAAAATSTGTPNATLHVEQNKEAIEQQNDLRMSAMLQVSSVSPKVESISENKNACSASPPTSKRPGLALDALSQIMATNKRAFVLPAVVSIWFADYAQRNGPIGIAGIPRLAEMAGIAPIDLPNRVGLIYAPCYYGHKVMESVSATTGFLFAEYAYFGLLALPLALLGLMICDGLLLVIRALPAIWIAPTLAFVSLAALKFTQSDYLTIWVTHGLGINLILIAALAGAGAIVRRKWHPKAL